MSDIPRDLRYTKSHEWLRTLPDGRVQVGITDHAQAALGDLVFVDVPVAGRTVVAGDAFAVVESVKAASDVYSPLPGTIIEGNARLADAPELLNRDPYGEGWLMLLQPASTLAQGEFLSAADYQAFLDSESA